MTMLGDSGTHLLGVAVAVTPGAAWLLLVPLLDAVRVVVGRWSRGKHFWEGDRTHLGNRLVAIGVGPLNSALVVVLLVAPSIALPALFADVWAQFGAVIKEGLYDAHEYRDQLNEVVRFRSTRGDDLVSLQDYIDNMKDGQEHIYYITAADAEAAKNSPQLEGFKAKGVEVLFMTDTIDEFWIQMANDFSGKSFKSVTRGGAELSKIKGGEEKPDNAAETSETTTAIQPLLDKLKTVLQDQVKDVTLSERLTESPVCLVADESGADMHIERVLKKSQGYDELTKRILEVNENHPVIKRLNAMIANDDAAIEDAAWLLLDQARIIEGEPLPDPASFARRMAKMMEKGL